jgi:hypothetical protein
LVKDLDEHKTMHNKLADQLHQEELKERDLEMKVKNSQDKVKVSEEKAKEQNMSLEIKNKTITEQRTHLVDLNNQLKSQLKTQNETQIQLNEMIKNNKNFKLEI